MEARRNLENIYKRRLDESEKKRYLVDLHLNVLKQYIKVNAQGKESGASAHVLTTKVHEFVEELNRLVDNFRKDIVTTSQSGGSRLDVDKLWEDSMNLSKLKLDKIKFDPKSVPLGLIGELVVSQINFNVEHIKYNLSIDTCLNCDLENMMNVIKVLHNTFVAYSVDYNISFTYEDGFLSIEMVHTTFAVLSTKYENAASILNGDVPLLDDQVVNMFIGICLCQSMGGDLERIIGNDMVTKGIRLIVPCQIVSQDQCKVRYPKVNSQKEPSIEQTKVSIPPELPKENPPIAVVPEIKPLPEAINTKDQIPISTEPPPSPPLVPITKKKSLEGKRLSILLIEDNSLLRSMFKKWWKDRQHNVFTANNGQEAIDLFKDQTFNIIFTDIEMPIKDGLTFAREVRAYEDTKSLRQTPIIGFSGYSTKQYQERAMESGMNAFVSKGDGYQFDEIYKIVEQFCGDDVA